MNRDYQMYPAPELTDEAAYKLVREEALFILKDMLRSQAVTENWANVGHLYRAMHQTYDEINER